MTDDKILKTIKKYVPDLSRIDAYNSDIDFYFDHDPDAYSVRSFIPKSVTRRALELAYYLPIGVYDLALV